MAISSAPPLPLRPVLAAADRMRTGLRLGVLVLVLMIPGIAATYAYTGESSNKIDFSASERAGTEVVRPALLALATVVAGRAPDLAPLRTAVAAHPELKVGDAVAAIPEATGTGPARLAQATALAALITAVGDSSNLILDPDLDSFYVMDAQIVQLPKALVAAAGAAAPAGSTGSGGATAGAAGSTGSAAVAAQAVRAGEISGAAASLRTDIGTAGTNTRLSDLTDRLATVGQAATVLAALATTLTDSLATPGPATVTPAATALLSAVDPLVDVLNDLLEARIGGFRRERAIVLIIAVGGFVLALWFAIAVIWRTRGDVALAVAAVTAIADGDFAARALPAGRDELGDLGRALGATRSRLVGQDTELRESHGVREEQLRVSFLHQRQAEKRLRDRAQTLIDESTAGIAAKLRQVTGQVGKVRQASDTIDTGIAATDAATSAVVGQARRAEEVIGSLEESLRRVATTAVIVNGIAGQTRLLALNATIEAARAGELGRGFTVVADEVKQLADTTSSSTEQIARTIQELERDTADMATTIAAMVAGIGGVGIAATSLRTVAADQGALVEKLARRMSETIAKVEEMSGLAAELERRRSDRIAVSGTLELRRAGSRAPIPATLLNISEVGFRVKVGPEADVPLDEVVDTAVGRADQPIPVHARVVNHDRDQLGLEFLISDDDIADRLERYVGGLVDGDDIRGS